MYLAKHFSNAFYFFFRMQNSSAAHQVMEEVALWRWVMCKAKAPVAAPAHVAGRLPGAGLSIPVITWGLSIPPHFRCLLPFSILTLNLDVLTGGGSEAGVAGRRLLLKRNGLARNLPLVLIVPALASGGAC